MEFVTRYVDLEKKDDDFSVRPIGDIHVGNQGFNKKKFEKVLKKSSEWGSANELMYVVGATQTDMLEKIRRIIPKHFLLVPGVGAQGGSLKDVSAAGMNDKCGLLVNSSRGIIYASQKTDFAAVAGKEAKKVQVEMEEYLELYL